MAEARTRHMHRANLFSHTDNFYAATAALKLAVGMGAEAKWPATIHIYGKEYDVSITDSGTWRVVES